MRSVSLLGSTGSIGRQTLDVVRSDPDGYRITVLGAHSSIDQLAAQASEFRPDVVILVDPSRAGDLRALLPAGIELAVGPDALAEVGAKADIVVNAVVGFAGLKVTLGALEAGKRLALANKESLIAAGPLVARVRTTPGAELLPVDSEHSAIHQCLQAGPADRVARLVLTASGGPFRGRTASELADISVADALAHPTWAMGPKITVDSSTLMNKGLEVIEAHELFGIDYDQIDVVVHPQSIVHSMVEFTDGSTVAQLSRPDMRLPIAYAMAWPDRSPAPFGAIDWGQVGQLEFALPDTSTFRCLGLAYEAGRAGGTVPAWLNAANEVAVAGFLGGELAWSAIPDVIEDTLSGHDGTDPSSVGVVIEADRRAREVAVRAISRRRESFMSGRTETGTSTARGPRPHTERETLPA